MDTIQIDAVYEHGTLKLAEEVPLQEGQRVTITIHPQVVARRRGGVAPWKGDPEELHRFLEDLDEGMWGNRDI